MAQNSQNVLVVDSDTNYLFWGNHCTEVADTLIYLQQCGSMVDVTLCANDNQSIKVHRMVLCASSPFLQQILLNLDDPNPCIIVPDVDIEDLKAIIDFVYRGEMTFLTTQLPALMRVAETLGIQLITEISSELPKLNLPVDEEENDESILPDVSDTQSTLALALWEPDLGMDEENDPSNVAVIEINPQTDVAGEQLESLFLKQKKKIRKEAVGRGKKYSEQSLTSALKQLQDGRTLLEVASNFGIPRTTLYMRARAAGILGPSTPKLSYTKEQIQDALEAIRGGSSLQQASIQYGIPKTVLWRRSQVFRQDLNLRVHQSYSPADRQAAVEALLRGEQLQTVASQFPIPKTTLFREKLRLVEKGELPRDCIKRRRVEDDRTRTLRVQEAVAACREGRMSQSAASSHYQIPKTTIWRHLQNKDSAQLKDISEGEAFSESEDQETFESENIEFVTEDGEFTTSSLIILSSVDADHLQPGEHLIVAADEETVISKQD